MDEIPSVEVEKIRSEIAKARGRLTDLRLKHPSWTERLDPAEGALTCAISFLYSSKEELIKYEIACLDKKDGKSLKFAPRGIGLDICPGCFVCGAEKRTDDPTKSDYLNNISAFVSSKEEGEEIVGWFEKGARLDFRTSEPNWIQIKVGACDLHRDKLQALFEVTSQYNRIRKSMINQS